MNSSKQAVSTYLNKAGGFARRLQPYSLIAFLVLVGLIYGFLMLRINALGSMEPSESDVTSQVKAAKVPYIDQDVVKQLQSLQDNSVSIQALFDQARSNPFQ